MKINDLTKNGIIYWTFYSIESNKIHFSFIYKSERIPRCAAFVMLKDKQKMAWCIQNDYYRCEESDDGKVYYSHGFDFYIEPDEIIDRQRIDLVFKDNEGLFRAETFQSEMFFPINTRCKHSYFYDKRCGIIILHHNGRLIIEKNRYRFKSELRYSIDLLKEGTPGRKALVLRLVTMIYKKCHIQQEKSVWLLVDRIMEAGDNAEAMFIWLAANADSRIIPYFVINKNSFDFNRMKKLGKVIAFGSFKHKIFSLISDVILSSAGDDFVINPVYIETRKYLNDIIQDRKTVFLQHGITKDDISAWINKYKMNFNGIVAAANKEYESFINNKEYFYSENSIWLTGFPRYDRLTSDLSYRRQITIMPTWRKYLFDEFDFENNEWICKSDFSESRYCLFYRALINDKRLRQAIKKNGYKLAFRPHPTIMPFLEYFDVPDDVIIDNRSYNEIFKTSSLLVNDYSSASIDFSYLKKPVIYCQFDEDEFFSGDHIYSKGYYDYSKDGFGPVTHELNETINMIIKYMDNNCIIEEEYVNRIERFFAFQDKCNSERVYQKVCELIGLSEKR